MILRILQMKEEYDKVNFELSKIVFDYFLSSKSLKFIYVSSVKAVADHPDGILDESFPANPATAYGRSKLKAEGVH